MDFSQLKKIIVFLVILGGIAYFGYRILVKEPAVFESSTTSSGEKIGQDIIDLAGELRGVSLDENILSSSLFTSLRDFSAPVVQEPQGRSNPFSAFSGEIVSVVSQNRVSTTSGTRR